MPRRAGWGNPFGEPLRSLHLWVDRSERFRLIAGRLTFEFAMAGFSMNHADSNGNCNRI